METHARCGVCSQKKTFGVPTQPAMMHGFPNIHACALHAPHAEFHDDHFGHMFRACRVRGGLCSAKTYLKDQTSGNLVIC